MITKDQDSAIMIQIPTDEVLVQQMKDGCREAFTQLYSRYWEDLFNTAARALRSKEEAADVVQDVFLSCWERREVLAIQGSLAAYLHTSIRYKCIHYIEKNITRRDYLLQLCMVEVSMSATHPELVLQLKDLQEAVDKAVAKMPPKMQQVYKLSRQEHLSYREIAEFMDISSETVKKHLHRALRLIRTSLAVHSLTLYVLYIFLLR